MLVRSAFPFRCRGREQYPTHAFRCMWSVLDVRLAGASVVISDGCSAHSGLTPRQHYCRTVHSQPRSTPARLACRGCEASDLLSIVTNFNSTSGTRTLQRRATRHVLVRPLHGHESRGVEAILIRHPRILLQTKGESTGLSLSTGPDR